MSQELTDAEWLRKLADSGADLYDSGAIRLRSIADRLERPGVEGHYKDLHVVKGTCEADDCDEPATDVAWDSEKGRHVSVCGQHGREIGESGQFTGCCTNCGCWYRDD